MGKIIRGMRAGSSRAKSPGESQEGLAGARGPALVHSTAIVLAALF